MLLLRLTRSPTGQPDWFPIEIALENDGLRCTASAMVAPDLTKHDPTEIRWYLEDALKDPHEPQPQIAASIERRTAEFVRVPSRAARRPAVKAKGPVWMPMPLGICRLAGDGDVPFRSVASRLVKGLTDRMRLDLLRPPSSEQLGRVLRQARDDGRPYHIVLSTAPGSMLRRPAGGTGHGGAGL